MKSFDVVLRHACRVGKCSMGFITLGFRLCAIAMLAAIGLMARADDLPVPVVSYSFDGANTNNVEGTGTAITWAGGSWNYVPSLNGKAGLLSGVSGGPWSNRNGGIDLTGSAWTIVFYARVPMAADNIVFCSGHMDVANSLALVSTGLNGVKVVYISSAKKSQDRGLSATVKNAPAEWHSYALVYENSTLSLFVDGVSYGSVSCSAPTDKSFQLGAFCGGTGNISPADGGGKLRNASSGAVDELRQYGSALTADQLAALHASFSTTIQVSESAPYYSTSFNGNNSDNSDASANLVSLWKDSNVFTASPNGQAALFDGNNRPYIDKCTADLTNWTCSFVALTPYAPNQIIFSFGRLSWKDTLILKSVGSEELALVKMAAATDNKTTATLISSIPVSDYPSYWHTYTLCYRSADSRLVVYVDDAYVGEVDDFAVPSNGGLQFGSLYGGNGSTGLSNASIGGVDEFRFYDRMLSPGQVEALHNSFQHETAGYHATLSGAVNWSSIPWDNSMTWANSQTATATLTLSGDTTLTMDEAVNLCLLTIEGPGTLTVAGTGTLTPLKIVCAPEASFGCPVRFQSAYLVDFDSPVTFADVTSIYPDASVVNSAKAATRTLYGTHNWTSRWDMPVCTSLDYGIVIANGATVNMTGGVMYTPSENNLSAFRIKEGGTFNATIVCFRTNTGYGIFEVSGNMTANQVYLELGGGCGFGSVDGSTTLNPTGLLTTGELFQKSKTKNTLAVNTVFSADCLHGSTGLYGTGAWILNYNPRDNNTSSDLLLADGVRLTAKSDMSIKFRERYRWVGLNGTVTLDTEDNDVLVRPLLSGGGASRLVKKGTGTVTIDSSDALDKDYQYSYAGGTEIQAGTVLVKKFHAAGRGGVTVANGATFAVGEGVNVSNAVTLAEGGRIAFSNVTARTEYALADGALTASGPATVVVGGDFSDVTVPVTIPLAATCDETTFRNLTLDTSDLAMAKHMGANLKRKDGGLSLKYCLKGFMVIIR